jgi:type I restriction enzyme M protein
MIETDLVDCMIALPGQLFYSTQIPACLWFLARDKRNDKFRDRRGQTLFIDARKLGVMIDRVHLDLGPDDIQKIAQTYHAWRGSDQPRKNPHGEIARYEDVPGFCKSANLDEIRSHGHVLTPGRYVGAEAAEDGDEPFAEKMQGLTAKLEKQFTESEELNKKIRATLEEIGYGL